MIAMISHGPDLELRGQFARVNPNDGENSWSSAKSPRYSMVVDSP